REDEELLAAPADAAEPWLHALRRADRMLAEIPVIAVAPSVRQHDFGCQRLAQPVDRYDLLVLPLAAAEHELADLQHVDRQQAQARGGNRLAVAAGRPFRRTEAQRLEQDAPRIGLQSIARAARDQPAEQRGRAAAIRPLRPRFVHDLALEHEAVAVG